MRTTTPKRPEVIGEEATAVVRAPLVPSKMMAAVLYGSEDLRLEKIDVPPLAADEVLLRVRLALTDGTDLKVWQRGYHAKMIQPPAVFGHEVVGEVAAVGKRVDSRWRLGLRVVAANSAPCLRCFHCRRGQENLCEDLLFNNGAYAEYMRIPGRIVMENMLEVPHSVDDGSAALVEPLACVLRGIHEMEVRTGDTAVVIGCGPIGLKYVRMLSRRGVRVIALARRIAPLEVARRMGAIATINVTQVRDVVAAVRNLTEDERGADSKYRGLKDVAQHLGQRADVGLKVAHPGRLGDVGLVETAPLTNKTAPHAKSMDHLGVASSRLRQRRSLGAPLDRSPGKLP